MKKFLFTLATLLMAGSMFAANENYFYLDNITLTKDEAAAGCTKVVAVKGHFDEAVSAWQVKFTLPEGVGIDMAAKGPGMTLTYWEQYVNDETLDSYYAEATYTPNLSFNADTTQFLVSVMDTKEYDPETGISYGICWRPGDYEVMWRVRLNFPAGFKGGDIVLNTQQSCGAKIMPGLTGCTLNPIDKTTEVRIKADKPEIAVTGDDYTKTVTITAEEGATIYYSTNGVDYQVYTAPIEFNKEGTYKVYAYAEGPGEGVERKSKSDVAESNEFTIKKKETPAFEATADVTFNENVATLTYKANDPDAEVVVKVDGTPTTVTWTYNEETKAYTATYTVVKSDEPGEHSVTVELTVTPSENYTGEPASDSDTYTYKVNDELKGEIVFGEVDPETGLMPVSYNGTEDGVELTVTVNGVEVPVVDGKVQLAEGENEVTATASAEGYNDKEKTDNVTWTKPLPKAPEATKTEDVTDTQVTVNFTPAEGTAVSVKVGDETVTLPYVINRPAYGEEPITVTFEVTVTGDNYTTNTYNVVVTVQPQDPTYASKPKITFTPNATGVNVKIENYTEYTITVNGELVDKAPNRAGTGSFDVEKGDVNKTIVAYAKNAPENMIEADTTATYLLAAKKVYNVPDPTITVDNSDPTKTVITIEATQGDLSYTLTDEDDKPFTDYTVEVVDGKTVITIENGEEVKTIKVTATTTMTEAPAGYDEVKNGEASKTVQTPVYVQPQTAAPTIDVSFAGEEGHYYANVTFKNGEADPNADIEYCLGDPTVEANWMPYTGAPVVITEDGSHTVYARATATGKATSEVADRTFELNQTATSVNELVNGKTVAGVRYFNMAGQEMQEANGITIVVTTYTDGTTSAVKVIK